MIKENEKYKFFNSREKHHFHLVDLSQLPSVTAFAVMLFILNIVFYLHFGGISSTRLLDHLMFHISWFSFSLALFAWFLIVLKESKKGYHTIFVRRGLKYGMVFFIVSEIMFFFAFFWAFFHVSLAPSIAVGGIWPPKSVQALEIWGLPLVNTLLLLSSGVTITFAHRALLETNSYNSFNIFDKYLWGTITLGLTFLVCQGIEYKYGITFHWKENVYASSFFVTTGFHGLHVTIGTIFLLFCLLRTLMATSYYTEVYIYLSTYMKAFFIYWIDNIVYHDWKNNNWKKLMRTPFAPTALTKQYSIAERLMWINEKIKNMKTPNNIYNLYNDNKKLAIYSFEKDQHLGFETGAWYWHFVDVVWIFLFITVYWWGSY